VDRSCTTCCFYWSPTILPDHPKICILPDVAVIIDHTEPCSQWEPIEKETEVQP
jgi:hypothetical protein